MFWMFTNHVLNMGLAPKKMVARQVNGQIHVSLPRFTKFLKRLNTSSQNRNSFLVFEKCEMCLCVCHKCANTSHICETPRDLQHFIQRVTEFDYWSSSTSLMSGMFITKRGSTFCSVLFLSWLEGSTSCILKENEA